MISKRTLNLLDLGGYDITGISISFPDDLDSVVAGDRSVTSGENLMRI